MPAIHLGQGQKHLCGAIFSSKPADHQHDHMYSCIQMRRMPTPAQAQHAASQAEQQQQHQTRSANSPCSFAQVLLRIGILRSQRSATDLHPYGFLKEKFLWALVSAVGIFCLGAGVTVAHGVMALNSPVAAMHDLTMNLAGGVLPVGQGL